MSLPSLFLKETSEGDISQTKLPQDMDLWAETISAKVRELIPGARHMIIKITFLKKNEEQGIATGSATIHDQKLNKAIYMPLIVKNFNLYPLDIMMVPKKDAEGGFDVMPYSAELFAQTMHNADPFSHLERPIDRVQQLYMNPQNSVVYPPNTRNVYASAGGQVLGAICDTIDPADKAEFIDYIKQSENVLIGYEKRANLDLIKKIAASKIKDTPEAETRLKNISLLKRKGQSNIQLITSSDEVFDPIIEEGKNGVAPCVDDKPIVSEETLNEVRRNGEKMIFNDLKPKEDVMLGPAQTPGNYTNTEDHASDIKVFGSYKVQDKNGVFHTGVVIPNVIDFNMKKKGGQIFFSLNKSSFQDKIVGIPTGKEPLQFLKFREPTIGSTGVFVTHNGKNALTTIPVTIRSMADFEGNEHIVAMDLNGRKIKIKYGGYIPENKRKNEFDASMGGLKNIAKVKDYYIVPRRFKFLHLDNFTELAEDAKTMSLKLASKKMSAAPIRVIHTGANQFALKGPDMTKMASMCKWDSSNLSASQAVFLLAGKKCPLVKAAEALRVAGSHIGETSIHGLPATKYAGQVTENTVKIAEDFVKTIKNIRVNLIKEASSIEDSQVVDAALSLNFVNPDNIDKFIGFVPLFEQASKGLAQTLLASRLGITEIPEQATAGAMNKIMEVVKGLKRLKSLEEKTASGQKALSEVIKEHVAGHAGKYMAGSGLFGMYVGSEVSKRKNYKKGFNHGAIAMRNYMNTK